MKKSKKRKYGPEITLYFTIIVMAVIIVTVSLSSVIAYILDYYFHTVLHIPDTVWLITFSILLGFVLTVFTTKKFFAPIAQLGEAMRRVAHRDFSVRLQLKTSINAVREIYDNFNLMVSELGTTEILQTDFVSNVSHEFKTPINAIEGYAMLLQEKDISSGDQAEYVDRIMMNTRRLSELVGNILLISKLENQAIPDKTEEYRLDEQIRNAILLLETRWMEKNIGFDIELEEIYYVGNESMMLHVWTNLLDNAIKFSNKEGFIKMRLKREGENALFTIEDNGCGISEEECRHIFEKFYQSDNSRRGEGSGLGLALVKQIVEIVGGTVSVESRKGDGAGFIVRLPCEKLNKN